MMRLCLEIESCEGIPIFQCPESRVYGTSSSTFTDQRVFPRNKQTDAELQEGKTWSWLFASDLMNEYKMILINHHRFSEFHRFSILFPWSQDIGAFVFLGELQFSINPAAVSTVPTRSWHGEEMAQSIKARVDDWWIQLGWMTYDWVVEWRKIRWTCLFHSAICCEEWSCWAEGCEETALFLSAQRDDDAELFRN